MAAAAGAASVATSAISACAAIGGICCMSDLFINANNSYLDYSSFADGLQALFVECCGRGKGRWAARICLAGAINEGKHVALVIFPESGWGAPRIRRAFVCLQAVAAE